MCPTKCPPAKGMPSWRQTACVYLLDRHIDSGNGARTALTGTAGELTYQELSDRGVPRFPVYAGVRADSPAPPDPAVCQR